MTTCQECHKAADAVRHEYTNERVLFIYTHSDGKEHKVWMKAFDAYEELRNEQEQR